MSTSKVYVVTDLGPGDGGKGSVIHKLSTYRRAHTIIKVGGSQGSHGVRTSGGLSFNFSFFGCGTLEGTRTHITRNMVIDPLGLVHEGRMLQYTCGVQNIFDLMTVDENTLCSTPFHTMSTQLRELARRDNPRGTIGTGVGEAYLDAEVSPQYAIRVRDLKGRDLCSMLEDVRRQKVRELRPILELKTQAFLEADRADANQLTTMLFNENFSGVTTNGFREMTQLVNIVGSDYLQTDVLAREGVAVVESSHGVLTDKYFGFAPHTSKLRTIPNVTVFPLLYECGYRDEIVHLGVTRAYSIRHGAGPMPTEDPSMNETLLPGSHKEENRWQGKVRVGPLDIVLLRYAIEVCGGTKAFDGIALTWFDQIEKNGVWSICTDYGDIHQREPFFFNPRGHLYVNRLLGNEEHLQMMEEAGKVLESCRPKTTTYDMSHMSKKEMIALCGTVLQEKLGVPVRMVSFGPTERDKICI